MNKGILFVIGTAIISGVSIFLNAFGVSGLNPFAFTGAKNLIVAILLISIIFLAGKSKEIKTLTKKEWGTLAVIGLIGGSIPFLLFFKGLSMGTGASGAFMHKTMILWVTLGALFFLKEKLNWKVITAGIAVLAGNFLLLNLNGIALSQGLFLTLLAALFWSVEILISKHALKKLSGEVVAFGRMGFGALFILIFLAVSGNLSAVFTWSASAWGWVAITALFLLGYVWTFYKGLQDVQASTAVAILSLGSIITNILQLAFLDKTFTVQQVVGFLLLLGGVELFVYLQTQVSKQANHLKKSQRRISTAKA